MDNQPQPTKKKHDSVSKESTPAKKFVLSRSMIFISLMLLVFFSMCILLVMQGQKKYWLPDTAKVVLQEVSSTSSKYETKETKIASSLDISVLPSTVEWINVPYVSEETEQRQRIHYSLNTNPEYERNEGFIFKNGGMWKSMNPHSMDDVRIYYDTYLREKGWIGRRISYPGDLAFSFFKINTLSLEGEGLQVAEYVGYKDGFVRMIRIFDELSDPTSNSFISHLGRQNTNVLIFISDPTSIEDIAEFIQNKYKATSLDIPPLYAGIQWKDITSASQDDLRFFIDVEYEGKYYTLPLKKSRVYQGKLFGDENVLQNYYEGDLEEKRWALRAAKVEIDNYVISGASADGPCSSIIGNVGIKDGMMRVVSIAHTTLPCSLYNKKNGTPVIDYTLYISDPIPLPKLLKKMMNNNRSL